MMRRNHKASLKRKVGDVQHLENEILKYENQYLANRLNSKENVLEFWEKEWNTFPNLAQLAMITLAAPGTQVSVEQLFSQLKFIMNDQRETLTPTNLENILLVRCNFEHLDNAFFSSVLTEKN